MAAPRAIARAVAFLTPMLIVVVGVVPGAAQNTPAFVPVTATTGTPPAPAGLMPAEWSFIQEAIERDQYALRRHGDAYHSINRHQRLNITFTSDGLDVTPHGNGRIWHWGLRLTAYGYGGTRRPLPAAERIVAGNRIEYRRGNVIEWYINDARGVEQGFTLLRPPGNNERGTPLVIELRALGGLQASITDDGLGIAWRDASGETALWYRGLTAWDNTGRRLPARISAESVEVELHVEDKDAVYPVTIDPFVQDATLLASDARIADEFGASVAIQGDTVAVGAPSSTDEFGENSGAVYVFVRDSNGTWREVAKLVASDASEGAHFGTDVGISDDTIIVGAPRIFEQFPGAAYVFSRHVGGTNRWGEVARLSPSDPIPLGGFGVSVDISDDMLVVGAPALGAIPSEAAYVYSRDRGGTNAWGEVVKLTANTGTWQAFGLSVAIDGDTVMAGAPFHADGSVYVFSQHQDGPDTWGLLAQLVPDPPIPGKLGMAFGWAVSIDGNQAVIGAPVSGDLEGAAYVFARHSSGELWKQVERLIPSVVGKDEKFGSAVSLSGDLAIVGNAPIVRCCIGAAHIFSRNQGGTNAWGEVARLRPFGIENGGFHLSVDIDGNTAIVGDPSVLDGQGSLSRAGSAHVFTFAATSGIPIANNLVTLTVVTASCCVGSAYTITAMLTNASTSTIRNPFFEVIELTGGNVLINADAPPGGIGATMTPDVSDWMLEPHESIRVSFVIELASRNPFRFLVNVRGNAGP